MNYALTLGVKTLNVFIFYFIKIKVVDLILCLSEKKYFIIEIIKVILSFEHSTTGTQLYVMVIL